MAEYTAWDLIGFDGTSEVIDRNLIGESSGYAEPGYEARPAEVRIKGGRTWYEAVGNDGGATVRLSKLNRDLSATVRYVDPDTILEVRES